MSEQFRDSHDSDDTFDAMMSQFEGDEAFAKSIENINDQLDEQDVLSLFDQRAGMVDPKGAYYSVPVDGALQEIVDGFREFCHNIGVSPNDDTFHDVILDQIQEHVVIEAYSIRDELAAGDVVSATRATVIDTQNDSGVDFIGDGQRIQGEVVGLTVGMVPDDVSVLTLNESGKVPLGVGLIIKDPVVIEEEGTPEVFGQDTKTVIIALGTLGLRVNKHFYQIDHLFVTPPDDTPTD
jgi:hypothetical protein